MMKRLRYIIRHLISMIVILVIVSFLVFFMLRLSKVDPVSVIIGNSQSTPELRAQIAQEYHLDQPIHVQYLIWAEGVLHGDFGRDYINGQDIRSLIATRIPVTLGLVIMSSLIGSVVAIVLGVTAAVHRQEAADSIISAIMLVMSGTPSFLAGILTLLFMTKFVPSYQFIGTYANFGEFLQRITIPSVILSFIMIAMMGRITRTSMIAQLQSPYVMTAAAKGLKKRTIIYKHALHNAILPVITVGGYMVAGAIGSSVVVEQIFSLPGIGGLLITAIEENNFPIIQILVLFMLVIYLVMSFVIDILYTVLDPRVELK